MLIRTEVVTRGSVYSCASWTPLPDFAHCGGNFRGSDSNLRNINF